MDHLGAGKLDGKPVPLPADVVLDLQAKVGNRAVIALLRRRHATPKALVHIPEPALPAVIETPVEIPTPDPVPVPVVDVVPAEVTPAPMQRSFALFMSRMLEVMPAFRKRRIPS